MTMEIMKTNIQGLVATNFTTVLIISGIILTKLKVHTLSIAYKVILV